MEKKEFWPRFYEYLQKFGRIALFALLFALGYFSSEIYHGLKAKECEKIPLSPKITKRIDKVSVAINERNELMIIDRTDGSYEIYQDSVGKCIFNLYANSIQNKYENP